MSAPSTPSAGAEIGWLTSRRIQIAVAVFGLQLAIFLMPAFNDFPFSRGHFMRSPSYYGVLLFVPLALACLWRVRSLALLPRSLLPVFLFLGTVLLSTAANFIRYSSDPGAMEYLMVMTQNCIVFSVQVGMVLATRALIVSGAISLEEVCDVVRISLGLIVLYCLYEVLAYFSGIGFFRESLKALEPFLHDLKTLNPNAGLVVEVHTPRVRGLAMEPSYFAAVFAFSFPLLVYNCIRTRRPVDYVIAILFPLMIYVGGARTALVSLAAQVIVILLILGVASGRTKLLAGGGILALGLAGAAAVLLPIEQIALALVDFDPTQFSNIMRAGGMLAAISMGLDHMLFGVGPGLSPYFIGAYYPDFVFNGPVADLWFDPARKTHEAFSGVGRILSDQGFPSLLAYLLMWFAPVWLCGRVVTRQFRRDGTINWLGLALAAGLVGQFQASVTIEPTTFVGYWIGLGLALAFVTQAGGDDRVARQQALAKASGN